MISTSNFTVVRYCISVLFVNFNICGSHVLKEPKCTTPTVVATGNGQELFERSIQLTTQTDDVITSRPTNVFDAICSAFCLYWVYDIKYNKHLIQTLTFLGSHVLKLETGKTTVSMQRRLNMLFSL